MLSAYSVIQNQDTSKIMVIKVLLTSIIFIKCNTLSADLKFCLLCISDKGDYSRKIVIVFQKKNECIVCQNVFVFMTLHVVYKWQEEECTAP